jgi:hypothetical protein
MAIHREDFAPACAKPDCKHVGEFIAFAPACHPMRVVDPLLLEALEWLRKHNKRKADAILAKAKAAAKEFAPSVKAVYSLQANEVVVRCEICDQVVTTIAVASRDTKNLNMVKMNGATGRAEPAPPPPQVEVEPSTPVASPQRMDRKAKKNRSRGRR